MAMRTVTYGGAVSLDGFLADDKGAVDWLHFSSDVSEIMATYWKTIDTLVMGRKTWEFALQAQAGGGDDSDAAAGMKTFVFSRTLTRIDRPGVELVSENAGEFVRKLKKQKGKGICVLGGGDFANSLFEAGVIDEVGLNIHPVLLGSGVPAFLDTKRRLNLELTECRQLKGGCVLVNYRVKRSRAANSNAA
jgi:dihydrofolate reductase